MREHPSSELIQAARQRLELKQDMEAANRKYVPLAAQFHHSDGLRQYLLELKQPGGLLPLSPPTLRGKIGAFLIRRQVRVLWWLVRALQLRDQALEAAYESLQQQEDRLVDLEKRLAALEGKSGPR
jgi:hypothetical protein